MITKKIKACLIDIDGTLTNNRAAPQISKNHILNNALFEVLADAMKDEGWEREQAAQALLELGDAMGFWDYPDFIHHFDLPEERTLRRLSDWHRENIKVYDDGVEMVRTLHDGGLDLYICSNNPFSGSLLKLQRAELSTLEGSPYFKGLVSSNVHKGQKGSEAFWQRGISDLELDPSTLAMIGDNPIEDGTRAREAGIQTIFLVDREQTEAVISTDEAFIVRRLTEVPPLLQELNSAQVVHAAASENTIQN